MPASFGPWQPWPSAPTFSERAFYETVDGGQAFRWKRTPEYVEGRWAQTVLRLRYNAGTIEFAEPTSNESSKALSSLERYFACDTDFTSLTDQLPWRNDPVLKTAIEHFEGLRILRQPFGETLFGFLCSSTKQIPQIKAICENVASSLGEQLHDGSHALPTWSKIAQAGEQPLRDAKLGYRARYIFQTACFLADNPGWLETTEASSTDEARKRLLELPGVGRKIADCVLLFGAGRLEAFPIDTWVEKILKNAYQMDNWTLPQLQDFARIHFGTTAGFAQQYLFAAARAGLIKA